MVVYLIVKKKSANKLKRWELINKLDRDKT